jgi:hypothetical protein
MPKARKPKKQTTQWGNSSTRGNWKAAKARGGKRGPETVGHLGTSDIRDGEQIGHRRSSRLQGVSSDVAANDNWDWWLSQHAAAFNIFFFFIDQWVTGYQSPPL